MARTQHAGDEIVVTVLDHDANLIPWRELAADLGVVVRAIPVASGTRLNALTQAIGDRTRVVAFPWADNVTGTELNVTQVAKTCPRGGPHLGWSTCGTSSQSDGERACPDPIPESLCPKFTVLAWIAATPPPEPIDA